MSTIIEASHLSVGYGRHAVLNNVNFTIAPGEFVLLVGPNGAGKSSLLRTLAGLQAPLGGTISIDGCDVARLSTARRARLLSLVTTERPASSALTVSELVSLGRHPHTGWLGRLSDTDRTIVAEAIERVGLSHKAAACISDISDGESQKAMIARALAQQTPVIMLDEPTSFLDVAARHEVSTLLSAIAKQGTAVLMSTHDIAAAMPMATHVLAVNPNGNVSKLATSDPSFPSAMTALFAPRGLRYDPAASDFRKE